MAALSVLGSDAGLSLDTGVTLEPSLGAAFYLLSQSVPSTLHDLAQSLPPLGSPPASPQSLASLSGHGQIFSSSGQRGLTGTQQILTPHSGVGVLRSRWTVTAF